MLKKMLLSFMLLDAYRNNGNDLFRLIPLTRLAFYPNMISVNRARHPSPSTYSKHIVLAHICSCIMLKEENESLFQGTLNFSIKTMDELKARYQVSDGITGKQKISYGSRGLSNFHD